jgi:hypothetical protein
LGRRQKALIFFAALLVMFGLGLWLQGRIFPFELSEPLVALAAVANLGLDRERSRRRATNTPTRS